MFNEMVGCSLSDERKSNSSDEDVITIETLLNNSMEDLRIFREVIDEKDDLIRKMEKLQGSAGYHHLSISQISLVFLAILVSSAQVYYVSKLNNLN